jgi:hypothetical protein
MILNRIAPVLQNFYTDSVTISRPSGSFNANGDWSPGTPSTFSMKCYFEAKQPDSEIVQDPSGDFSEKRAEIWTLSEIRERDTFSRNSVTWQIREVEYFQGASFYKGICARLP